MKANFLKATALLLLSVAVVSCSDESGIDDGSSSSTASQITLNKSEILATDATIEITTDGDWAIKSNRSWCQPEVSEGNGSATVKIIFEDNSLADARSAKLTFYNDVDTHRIVASQEAGVYSEDMHYKLPIVFHTFYARESNESHYISEERIGEIFECIKESYANCGVDLGFEFVLAEEDPDGETMDEAGINRIYQQLSVISYTSFMYGLTSTNTANIYADFMWDPSKYINIAVYQFSESSAPVGISQSAYLMTSEYDEDSNVCLGAVELKNYVAPTDLTFPMCISLNNTYIFNDGSVDDYFNDIKSTAAHELGHLLGLRHVFYENVSTGDTYGGGDTDYCTDTPTYNRPLYSYPLSDMVYAYSIDPSQKPTDEEVETIWKMRTASSVIDVYDFKSTNIMDYSVGEFSSFSEEQKARMRYIIQHSPYIPGCKAVTFDTATTLSTKSASEVPVKLHECSHHIH